VLLKIITEIARPQMPASVQMLKNNITNMSDKMTEFGQDIEKFNAYVIKQIQGLATYGRVYDNVEYHLLQAYDRCTNQVFYAYLTKIKDEHETGERSYSYDQIMKLAVNKFHLMVQKNEWNPGKGSLDDRLLALESRTSRIPKKNQGNKVKFKEQGGDNGADRKYTPKGGNWINTPPKGGVDKKATLIRKTKNGEKTFYWCHRKTGGQCDPRAWRTHKPEDCRSDQIKAEREKKQQGDKKDKSNKGKTLQVEETIVKEKGDGPKQDDEFSDTWRDDDPLYDMDSDRSLSSGTEQERATNPYFYTRKAKAREEKEKAKRNKRNKKKLMVEEAKVTDNHEPKKARTEN